MKVIRRTSLITGLMLFLILPIYLTSPLSAMTLSGEKTRGPVEFTHDDHMSSFDCLDCHHVMKNGKNVLDESVLEEGNPDILCGSCHTDETKISKREAFHYQCIRCHDSQRFTKEPTGPTLCGECHILNK
jgi:c(7)-type cytochrome triheme protein